MCFFNQNIYNKDFIEGYKLIQDYSPTIINLTENCRNTYKISKYNKNLTGFSIGENKKIIGEDVEVEQYENKTDLIKKVVRFVKRLINQGIRPGDIVILSPKNFENSAFSGENFFEDICKFQDISGRAFSQYYKDFLKFSTIHSFKGMESKIIILMDLEEFNEEYYKLLNYIGISRAKALLYVFYNKNLTEDYYQVINTNK